MTIKNGKKPLSSKPSQRQLTDDDVFGNPLTLPPALAAELEAGGYAHRWLDAQELYKNGGYHKRGWTAYISKKGPSDTMNPGEFRLGRDPEGTLRRGSLILGIKPKDQVDLHRELLRQKNARISRNIQKEKAQELKQQIRDSGLDAKVHAGYDDEGENE